jgi:hypothetical protein
MKMKNDAVVNPSARQYPAKTRFATRSGKALAMSATVAAPAPRRVVSRRNQ